MAAIKPGVLISRLLDKTATPFQRLPHVFGIQERRWYLLKKLRSKYFRFNGRHLGFPTSGYIGRYIKCVGHKWKEIDSVSVSAGTYAEYDGLSVGTTPDPINPPATQMIWGGPPSKCFYGDWLIIGERWHIGSIRLNIPNTASFHGISHPIQNSTPFPKLESEKTRCDRASLKSRVASLKSRAASPGLKLTYHHHHLFESDHKDP